MKELIAIGAAGALGSISRHGVGVVALRWCGDGFPYGTLIVNVLGSAALGVVTALALTTDLLPPSLRVPLATGFLGAFTTFSTFSVDTVRLAERDPWLAVINVVGNLVLGGGAAWCGLVCARWCTS